MGFVMAVRNERKRPGRVRKPKRGLLLTLLFSSGFYIAYSDDGDDDNDKE